MTEQEREIMRCSKILGHPSTRAERDAIRQAELRN
jgi:hypothetical protein